MNQSQGPYVQLASASLGLGSALRRSLEELAKFHKGEAGTWLDELEREFIENVKRSFSEGLSMEAEVQSADFAIALIRLWVDTARRDIKSKR